MSKPFMDFNELVDCLPWGKTTVNAMVSKGIYKAFKNPLCKRINAKRVFLREQVEEANRNLIETMSQNTHKNQFVKAG